MFPGVQSFVYESSINHTSFIGCDVKRHLCSKIPENSCMPKTPKKIIKKTRKNSTFVKAGIESIKDSIKTLIPINELKNGEIHIKYEPEMVFRLLKGLITLNIFKTVILGKFGINPIILFQTNYNINKILYVEMTTAKSIRFHPSLKYVFFSKMKPIAITFRANSNI